jgi:ADYC domain
MMRWLLGLLLLMLPMAAPAAERMHATLRVEGTRFVLVTADGRRLPSEALVGAVFTMMTPGGVLASVRIDGVTPAKDRSAVLLHDLKVANNAGEWVPMCDADAYGRRAAFPVAGRWEGQKFRADKAAWFLTCTSGSQAKCLIWGYDPWAVGPGGVSLVGHYEACQHMVRGDYDGRGAAHTRNGTSIDLWDDLGLQTPDTAADKDYIFEAGWAPDGSVCVAKTRWASLLPLSVLLQSVPRLKAQPCDEAEARRRGALIFNRSKVL